MLSSSLVSCSFVTGVLRDADQVVVEQVEPRQAHRAQQVSGLLEQGEPGQWAATSTGGVAASKPT
jgi:hypothetical protein